MRQLIILSISTLMLFTLSGCSSDKSNIATDNTQIVEDTAIPSIIPSPMRRVQDCVIVANDQLPSNWPDDIPFYINSTITLVECTPNDSDMYTVRLRSTDQFDTIVNFFEDQVSAKGWIGATLEDTGPYGYTGYKSMNANKPGRELILDIRHSGNDLPTGTTEIIYRERSY